MTLGTYTGEEKLCFGLDVGTTMSAVSFAHFENGEEPQIRMVTRWPGQEEAQGDCKIPTVVRYNSEGHAVQFGAEAIENFDGLEDTTLATWFKIHLHPEKMRVENRLTSPPLPKCVNIKTVYTDFLSYLFSHARNFLNESSLVGREGLFDRLKDNFVVVLAIPNGWDSAQQAFLRDAVVSAGILSVNHDRDRLQFVSEAEASVHFAINYARIGNWLREGMQLAVCDAGGSTLDTTVYTCISAAPRLQLKETTSSECVQAGSVFVDEAARSFLGGKLASSTKYGSPEVIECMVRTFEKKTKRKFDGKQDKSIIEFGQAFDTDRPHVYAGRVSLSRDETKLLFHQPVTAIGASIDKVMERAGGFESLLLVGGFAESAYLQATLRERLLFKGVKQVKIDEATKKAAAEGAVAWFAKQCVVARATRATYGVAVRVPYNDASTEHRQRSYLKMADVSSEKMLFGRFDPLILKNEVVENDMSTQQLYGRRYRSFPSDLKHSEVEIYSTDDAKPNYWCRDLDGKLNKKFRSLCTLKADLSGLKTGLRPVTDNNGNHYWQIAFRIEVFFGRTTLEACLVWDEEGQTRKGPVTIIPNSTS